MTLSRRSKRLAGALRQAHIKPKDVISIVSSNCIEYPVIYLAVTWIGAIFQPLNPLYTIGIYFLN